MKKNILLVLLSCFALSGCKFDLSQLKFWESKNNSQESSNNKGEGETIDPVDPNDPHDHQAGSYWSTINLSGSDLASFTSGQPGFQFDDVNHPNNVAALQNYCASKVDGTNMLTQINCSNCNTGVFNSTLYFCLGTGYYVNGAFKEGLFKWTSLLDLHSVEIKCMAYSKLDNNGSTDGQSVVWIDDTSLSLETPTDASPTIHTLKKDYPSGTQSFSIKSTGSRVFIESITIVWNYLYEA